MANEVVVKTALKVTKGGVTLLDRVLKTLQADMAGQNVIQHVQSIAITEVAITLGDITVGGWVYFENLDSTNTVTIRQATGAGKGFADLKPGEGVLMRSSTDMTAPYAIADTAPCDLLVAWADR